MLAPNEDVLKSERRTEFCSASARALRDEVKSQGYDHDLMQRFVRELDDGQELLF